MSKLIGHILVDANIAQSAADPARHPTSLACFDFARNLSGKSCKTGAAITPALESEWKRHASPTMVAWLADMESRGRVRHEPDRRVRDLRRAVKCVTDEGIRAALEKDIHISEAAIFHGFPVASLDDRQRKFLAELAKQYPRAGQVQWLNPVKESNNWHVWLSEGCGDRTLYCCSSCLPGRSRPENGI